MNHQSDIEQSTKHQAISEEADDDYEDDDEEEAYERRNRGCFIAFLKTLVMGFFLLFFFVVGIMGAGAYYVYSNLQPLDPESIEYVEVQIPLGSSASRIATVLESNGIIKNNTFFYYYVRYRNASGFQAGEYYLSPSMTFDEIIEQLKDGRVYLESDRFTIPEGLAVEQIADLLETQGLINREIFLELIIEGDFSEFAWIADIPESEDRKYRLEGFLFPETYEIYKGADEAAIIRRMLAQFDKEFKQEWLKPLEEKGMTMYDAVILASIVEREAVLAEERATIAGVFTNRIRENWMLQSCATVQFVLGKQRERLLFSDLEAPSPYNTYINQGLPPGPIASPGRSALLSVIEPEEHEYFFFVTRKDGSGGHHFSSTYEEHLRNDAQSRGNF